MASPSPHAQQPRPAPQSAAADDAEELDTKPAAASSAAASHSARPQPPGRQQRHQVAAPPPPEPEPVPDPVPSLLATPWDVQIRIYTYLRATDLSSLQRVARPLAHRPLVNAVIRHTAQHVYPPSLTVGYDTPAVGGPVHTRTHTATAAEGGTDDVLTYEMLRNMEMLVVARVLSRPEPLPQERRGAPGGFYYVSKAWCRTALRWLEVQQEEQREAAAGSSGGSGSGSGSGSSGSGNPRNPHASRKKKKKKPTRKDRRQERLRRHRKASDVVPPWQNINHDLVCPHGDLARCSSKSARARRRIMDKQAWKVLNRLYPDSVSLSSVQSECVQCVMEQETAKKTEADRKERETKERKRPLSCPVVRGIYTRSKGVPASCLARGGDEEVEEDGGDLDRKPAAAAAVACSTPNNKTTGTNAKQCQQRQCPLVPGVFNALPRSWLYRWRKFLKTGEGERPVAPDATALLCDAHRLPLVPPHLEAYLYGDAPALLGGSGNPTAVAPCLADDADAHAPLTSPSTPATMSAMAASSSPFSATPVGCNPVHSSKDEDDHADADTTTFGTSAAAAAASSASANEEEEEEEAIIAALRAAGLSEAELHAQRLAMQNHERQSHMAAATATASASASSSSMLHSPSGSFRRQTSVATINNAPITTGTVPNGAGGDGGSRESINEQLDRENYRVVEILTDEEFTALEKWWPDISVNYALRFAVAEDGTGRRNIIWSTPPCRECDASGKNCQTFAGMRLQRARRIRRDGHVPNGKGR